MDDEVKRMLQVQREMDRIADTLGSQTHREVERLLAEQRDMNRIAAMLEPSVSTGALIGSRWESGLAHEALLSRAGIDFALSTGSAESLGLQASEEIRQLESAVDVFNSQFRHPHADEVANLAAQAIALSGTRYRDVLTLTGFADHLHEIDKPWLHIGSEMDSASAVAGIFGISGTLTALPPYDAGLASMLRESLGDWRDIELPSALDLYDPATRVGFYRRHGFDEALTDFPSDAFEETLNLSGLDYEREGRGKSVVVEDDCSRATSAFEAFRHLEICLRNAIQQKMQEMFGDRWEHNRLPNGMLESWKVKREQAQDGGESEQPLICYADFSDYERIISRKDNWREVFAAIFSRREDVRESLVRLRPMRLPIMHARQVTMEDEIFLRVEAKRILKALRRVGLA